MLQHTIISKRMFINVQTKLFCFCIHFSDLPKKDEPYYEYLQRAHLYSKFSIVFLLYL